MTTYNGHRSWNAWNISLWIANDEALYRWAVDCIEQTRNKDGKARLDKAARMMMQDLGGQRTPDGAKYNLTCIREAMAGLVD